MVHELYNLEQWQIQEPGPGTLMNHTFFERNYCFTPQNVRKFTYDKVKFVGVKPQDPFPRSGGEDLR